MSKLEPLRSGDLEVRLAVSEAEVAAGQALRYRVFYDEMGARPTPAMAAARRDMDAFDEHCDHLLVIDRSRAEGPESVIGTYRMNRRAQAAKAGGFYTADEYDIRKIEAFDGEILELGRSCVDVAYRNRPTMQLLWRGIAAYVFHHNVDLMFGCASLHGTDPKALATELSYLRYHHLAPPALRAKAVKQRYTDMRLMKPKEIDAKKAIMALPPLVKGYIRLGAFVGDGAVVDEQFNTTDVCIILKTDLVAEKYLKHYDRTARPL